MSVSEKNNYERIVYEVSNGVGRLTFNLPQFANALDFQGVRETFDALMKAERDKNVGCVLITGAGNAFCAGDQHAGRIYRHSPSSA